ncbi:MAG TPA: YppF family protein [Lentibacillus sp.]|uniref:YppF family protein n=1 Tax=Lentibacillus sp. TaxID=1925746 RepID=UPI002B4AD21F|nr:YppF family protein [Lentibacillus sp.]HLR62879.1 YppF family protein [Lentibacillus sp.]
MSIFELITIFETERHQPPESINALLDFYQQKYITGDININDYRKIYHYLHRQGAISAHELA